MNDNSKSGKAHKSTNIIGGLNKYDLERPMNKRQYRRTLARLERLTKKKERQA